MPLEHGEQTTIFDAYAFENISASDELLVLVRGSPASGSLPIVRLHSACVTGDALGSLRCDCRFQLRQAIDVIAAAPYGILIYLNRHEGRGIGLANKIRAYGLQETGRDTVDANVDLGLAIDARDYAGAIAALNDFGARQIRLMSNNPAKFVALSEGGIEVVERIPVSGGETLHNGPYLRAKRDRMNHLFEVLS